ncbi:hypothetical protein Ancab_021339 [Ancistrocladus abbreviatus]
MLFIDVSISPAWISMETQLSSYGVLTPIPLFMLMFFMVYVFGYSRVFHNWDPKLRIEASSCFMSLAHGTPAILLSTYALISSPHQAPNDYASPNTPLQNLVLEYSLAYFLMDLFHYLLFIPSEVLYIVHHVATLYVLVTCRYMVQHGAFPILVVLIVAEMTSPCQNVWTITGFRRSDVAEAAKLYESMSPGFYTYYSVVRGIAAPLFTYKLGVFFVKGRGGGLIPPWAWISWMVAISGGIFVSWLWVLNLWIALYTERKGKQQKEK